MGEVVELRAWREGRPPASSLSGGPAERPAASRARNVARVRPILPDWHPSLGGGTPSGDGPGRRNGLAVIGGSGRGMDAVTIARLDRAVVSIDRATSRVAAKGGRLPPDIETELLALVGQISMGMIADAADRAERMARGLGGAASSGP